jgi:hypothetical protein
MNDPAASGWVSQGISRINAASSGESDPSERPEAQSPTVKKKRFFMKTGFRPPD